MLGIITDIDSSVIDIVTDHGSFVHFVWLLKEYECVLSVAL